MTQVLQGWGFAKGKTRGQLKELQTINSLDKQWEWELAAEQDRQEVCTKDPADLP